MEGSRKAGYGLALLTFAAITGASPARAQLSNQVITGNFTQDNDVLLERFTLSSTATYKFFTTSYGGGVNDNGTTTPSGGFDPNLGVYNAQGDQLAFNDDGGSSQVNADPNTHNDWDASLTTTLTPGTYYLALAQYQNEVIGGNFRNGFTNDGNPDYTRAFVQNGRGSAQAPFVDEQGNQRTGNYTLNITAAPVPEASTLVSTGLLLLLGIGGAAWSARRRKAGGSA